MRKVPGGELSLGELSGPPGCSLVSCGGTNHATKMGLRRCVLNLGEPSLQIRKGFAVVRRVFWQQAE